MAERKILQQNHSAINEITGENKSMSTQNDKWLYDLAKQANTYIEDDGFTDNVVAQLPVKRKRYQWILPVSIAIGMVMTIWLLPNSNIIASISSHMLGTALLLSITIPVVFKFLQEEYDL